VISFKKPKPTIIPESFLEFQRQQYKIIADCVEFATKIKIEDYTPISIAGAVESIPEYQKPTFFSAIVAQIEKGRLKFNPLN
jgi:hypothetical protein